MNNHHLQLRLWFFPGQETFRRTLVGMALTVVVVASTVGVSLLIEPDDPTTLILLFGALAVGFYVRSRTVLWAAYVGFVLSWVTGDVACYLYLGGTEWALRNSEHWPMEAPPLSNLLGQLLEYAIFGIFFAALAGAGALAAHLINHWRNERDGWRKSPTV